MSKISEGIQAILALEAYVQVTKSPFLHAFIHDIKRFVLYNQLVIEQAPLQLYCAALLFAPENSITRRQFRHCIPPWIQFKPSIGRRQLRDRMRYWMKLKPRVQAPWNAGLQTLEGHTGSVTSIAFSPDGKQVVSSSRDRTRLWDAATGKRLQTLEGHTGSITSVAFSPNGKLLPILRVFNHWVAENDTNILWLPPNYRETVSATWNRSLVIGHSSGRISFFCFKKGANLII
ncbi:WD40 repeat-like protein [Mollisia scopiformis]|uniref:Mitochondrial division protein 1 n=1 Tax=Mollisia scopiformis TaxID=149040 RepID=A0A194XKY5_MOLSC|nr:WD40 repeat-like protein [Mollisia scopiformis]KUJ20838.1 WD40 repeat-like protein [Mollisia scopiformis]